MEESIGYWSRGMGTAVACLLLIAVAVRASTAISGERDRLTWDGLLASPLERWNILFAKLLGSMASVRWGWLWLGLIWGWGCVEGDLRWVCLPILGAAWLVYALLLANVGLWMSVTCPTSRRATTFTILSTLGLGVGILAVPIYAFIVPGAPGRDFYEWLFRLQLGLTPAIAMGRLLPILNTDFARSLSAKDWWEEPVAVIGLCFWSLVALSLWFVTLRRLRRAGVRGEPDLRHAPQSAIAS